MSTVEASISKLYIAVCGLIRYNGFEEDGLVEFYGTMATINGIPFKNGDSVAEILKVLGPRNLTLSIFSANVKTIAI